MIAMPNLLGISLVLFSVLALTPMSIWPGVQKTIGQFGVGGNTMTHQTEVSCYTTPWPMTRRNQTWLNEFYAVIKMGYILKDPKLD